MISCHIFLTLVAAAAATELMLGGVLAAAIAQDLPEIGGSYIESGDSISFPGDRLTLETLDSEMISPDFLGYRLGPGDLLNISVFAADEYSGEVVITQDGSVRLPQAGRVELDGLTLDQATTLVTAAYAPFIRNPIVTIQPLQFRPVRVGIAGEVKRPGAYVIAGIGDVDNSDSTDLRFPTLTQAILEAGGITAAADVRSVEVRRNLGRGRSQVLRVNLWELIQGGALDQDVILQSGDEVIIPTATTLTAQEAAELGRASFAPATIQIYVAGEVENPGLVEVPSNTPLNRALLAAGGFNPRANRSTIELVRLNSNGTVVQQVIEVDLSADLGDDNNPILNDQDVILVNRSGLARFGDTADIVLSPLSRILSTILGLERIF